VLLPFLLLVGTIIPLTICLAIWWDDIKKDWKLRRYQLTAKKSLSISIDCISFPGGQTVQLGDVAVGGETWVATTTIAGMQFRGPRGTNAVTAIQALLMTLANPQVTRSGEPDPVLALGLLTEGTTLDQVMTNAPALPEETTGT